MSTQRFTFPGFIPVRQADTSTHEVEIGKIKQGDEVFVVHMIRKTGLSFEGNFLVAEIRDHTEKVSLWKFSRCGFDGLGLLAQVGDEAVVALVGKGREGKVEEIIILSTITESRPMSLQRRVKMKRLAAEYLNRQYHLTETERAVIKRDNARRLEEERAAREAAHEARRKAREELIARITARGRVEAFTADGSKRFGFPVVDNEWQSLSNGTYVVLVESYDDEHGTVGDPIEAFQIVKEKGRNPKKGFPTTVTWKQSTESTQMAAVPQPVETTIVEMGGEDFEIAVYDTMDDIRAARRGGLNSGALVAARDRTDGERYEVFSVRAEEVRTLGLFEPIA